MLATTTDMISTDTIFEIVDLELTYYKNHWVPRELLMRADFGFSSDLHLLRQSFWRRWRESEDSRADFINLVYDTLNEFVAIKRGKTIEKSEWGSVLAKVRIHLACILSCTEDAAFLGQGQSLADVGVIEHFIQVDMGTMCKRTKELFRKRQGVAIVNEWIDGDARAVVQRILHKVESIAPNAVFSTQYIEAHTCRLLRNYDASGNTFFDQCHRPAFMNACHVADKVSSSFIVDHIIEHVIRMYMAHQVGMLYYYPTEAKNAELSIVYPALSPFHKRSNIQQLITALTRQLKCILSKHNDQVDIGNIVNTAYRSIDFWA